MPFNTQVWVVDERPDCLTVYIDESLITEPGAAALQSMLRTTFTVQRRTDEGAVFRTLKAVTG